MTKRKNDEAAVQAAMDQIESKHGKGSIMKLGEAPTVKVPVIPTGSLSIDLALGAGGLPKGRIIEIYGSESSGKTTVSLHTIAEAQKRGGRCAFIDAEHALDPGYAEAIGVDLHNLYLSQPDYGEQALEIVDTLVRSASFDVIVVDSVAALIPKRELEGEMGESHVGLQARLMSQALRKLAGNVSKTNTILIFINQIREKIGVMFGSPETTTGGRALKFYASVRLDVRRISPAKDGQTASRHRIKVVKNKVGAPFRQAEFDLEYGRGISVEGDALDLALENGLVTKRGSWFDFKSGDDVVELGNGRDAAKRFLAENPEVLAKMDELVREVAL